MRKYHVHLLRCRLFVSMLLSITAWNKQFHEHHSAAARHGARTHSPNHRRKGKQVSPDRDSVSLLFRFFLFSFRSSCAFWLFMFSSQNDKICRAESGRKCARTFPPPRFHRVCLVLGITFGFPRPPEHYKCGRLRKPSLSQSVERWKVFGIMPNKLKLNESCWPEIVYWI